MVGSPATVNELLELLAQLNAEEEAIMRQVESRLAEVRKKKDAVQTTLELLSRGQEQGATGQVTPSGWAQKLRGLTQLEALACIARENNGTLRVPEVKRIFISTGLAKGKPKYISGHIYHMLNDSGRFEHIGPGTFRLVAARADDSEAVSLRSA